MSHQIIQWPLHGFVLSLFQTTLHKAASTALERLKSALSHLCTKPSMAVISFSVRATRPQPLLRPTSHHAAPHSLWDTQGSLLGFVHAKRSLTPGPLLLFPLSGMFFTQVHVIHALFSLIFAQVSASHYVFPK